MRYAGPGIYFTRGYKPTAMFGQPQGSCPTETGCPTRNMVKATFAAHEL